jgi:hypothetical protein
MHTMVHLHHIQYTHPTPSIGVPSKHISPEMSGIGTPSLDLRKVMEKRHISADWENDFSFCQDTKRGLLSASAEVREPLMHVMARRRQ